MGFLPNPFSTDPKTTTVDPTPDVIKGTQGSFADLFSALAQDPSSSPFSGLTSDLQRGATGGILQFLNANPEQQTFESLQPGLMDLFGQDSASAVGEAAFPLFQRGLQEGLTSLSNRAPGRFSTTFARQGVDLSSRALQDFNLLQQQAFQQNQQSRLGAAGLLGTLASSAGQGAFGRNLAAGQLGLGQTQAATNPVLQLLLGGAGFAQPFAKDTIVGPSNFDRTMSVLDFLASAGVTLGGGGGKGAKKG